MGAGEIGQPESRRVDPSAHDWLHGATQPATAPGTTDQVTPKSTECKGSLRGVWGTGRPTVGWGI